MELDYCPFCKEEIEADSIFCDQCGSELRRCTNCGGFCKGNFCSKCGNPSVKASEYAAHSAKTDTQQSATSNPVQQQPVVDSVQLQPGLSTPEQQPRPTTVPDNNLVGYPATVPAIMPARMVCREYGIVLPLQPGAILGRITGNYAHLLGQCNFISGTHARLDFNGKDWTITDLGSRNGTTVNGMPVGGMPVALQLGAIVQIARTYNFIIE